MRIWIFLISLQGISASAESIDASDFVQRRGGYDEKDAYYLNNHFSPDADYVPPIYSILRNYDRQPYPNDNGQEPSLRNEFVVQPSRIESIQPNRIESVPKVNKSVKVKGNSISAKLAAVLHLVRFKCEGHREGYYADVDFDCRVFHFCSTEQVRYTFMCGGNAKFNQQHLVCDYQQSTNCSEAYSKNSNNERHKLTQVSSVDPATADTGYYEELPELVRTKRIGNDFAEPEEFDNWKDKFDPFRYKRSPRVRRYTHDGSREDLLALSSESRPQYEELFTDRVGSIATDDQWRSTGINLPNQRKSFSPYQQPRQATHQTRQALHDFRQDPKIYGGEPTYRQAPTQRHYQDNNSEGRGFVQNQDPEYLRPQRETGPLKFPPPKSKKSFIADEYQSENVFTNYETSSRFEPPRISPAKRQQFEVSPPSLNFGRPSSFGNFFEPSLEATQLERSSPPAIRPASAVVEQYTADDFGEPSATVSDDDHLEKSKPKKKQKQKKRRKPEDEYEQEAPVSEEFFHERLAIQKPLAPQVSHALRPLDGSNQASEGYKKPHYEPHNSSERPGWQTDNNRNTYQDPNQFRQASQPTAPRGPLNQPPPQKQNIPQNTFGMGMIESGIKNLVPNTLSPVSTTQSSPRQRRPQVQPPPQGSDARQQRPWGQEQVPQPRQQNIPQPPHTQHIQNTQQPISNSERREQPQAFRKNIEQPIAPIHQAENKQDWVPENASPKGMSEGRMPNGKTHRDESWKDQSIQPVEARLDRQNAPEMLTTPAKLGQKRPENQNLPQLSWSSIFNNAESYESVEEEVVTEAVFQQADADLDDAPKVVENKPPIKFKHQSFAEIPPHELDDFHGTSSKYLPNKLKKSTTEIPEEHEMPEEHEAPDFQIVPTKKRSKQKSTQVIHDTEDLTMTPLRKSPAAKPRQEPGTEPVDSHTEDIEFPTKKSFPSKSRKTTPTPPPEEGMTPSAQRKKEFQFPAFPGKSTKPTTVTPEEPEESQTEKKDQKIKIKIGTNEETKIERLSNYKKRIENQRESVRQRAKTTTTESSVVEDIVTEPTEGKLSNVEDTAVEPEPESSTRIRFPQRTRTRSRSSTEKPEEIQAKAERSSSTSDLVTENVPRTTATTTPSPRKSFDLNKFRSSNRLNYPKLRSKDDQESEVKKQESELPQETKKIKKFFRTTEATEPAPTELPEQQQEESFKRKPGRKRFGGGLRRRVSTTPGSVTDEDDESAPKIQEIAEVDNNVREEKKQFRRQDMQHIRRSSEEVAGEENEDQVQEGSSTSPTALVHVEPEHKIVVDEESSKSVEVGTEAAEEDKNDVRVVSENTSAKYGIVEIENVTRIVLEKEADIQPSSEPSSNEEVKETSVETASQEEPTDTSVETDTAPQSRTEAPQSRIEVIAVVNPTSDEEREKTKTIVSEEETKVDRKADSSSEDTEINSDVILSSPITEPSKKSSEEITSTVLDTAVVYDSSSAKYEKKVYAVTNYPRYFTMATHDPILPIEELLPLFPRDNGRGM